MTAAVVAGVALLGLLFWDVVWTLFAPYGSHGGPLHRRQNQRAADAHARFPLVHYFRPLDANRSLLLQMGWLLSLARARSLPGDSSEVALGPASADLLFESVIRYLLVVNRGCVPGSFDPLRRVMAHPPSAFMLASCAT